MAQRSPASGSATPGPQSRRTPASRTSITRAWLAAHTATQSLKRLKALPSLEKLQALVDAGAIVPQAGMGLYNLALAADDAAALGVLLSGSESLGAESRWGLVAAAARKGAARCLARMLALDFPLVPPPSPRREPGPHQAIADQAPILTPALTLAVARDRVDAARVLLEAGAGQAPADAGDTSYFAWASSPAMVALLAEHGLRPLPADAVSAGALKASDPDPELLEAFLRVGLKVRAPTQEAPIGWAGTALFEKLDQVLYDAGCPDVDGPEGSNRSVDRLVACARLLHEAGYPWAREVRQAGPRMLPHALAVLACAGVPAQALEHRGAREYVPSPVLSDGRWSDPQAGYHLAADQLRVLARAGVDTDVFWNPGAPGAWKHAMIQAGVLPLARTTAPADLSQFPASVVDAGRQARLDDRLAAARPGRPAPRL